jgi:hypothetical protein
VGRIVVPDDDQRLGMLRPQLLQEGYRDLGGAVALQLHDLDLAGFQAHGRVVAGLLASARSGRVQYACSRTRSHSSGVSRPALSQTLLGTLTRPRSCTSPARRHAAISSAGNPMACAAGSAIVPHPRSARAPTGTSGRRNRRTRQPRRRWPSTGHDGAAPVRPRARPPRPILTGAVPTVCPACRGKRRRQLDPGRHPRRLRTHRHCRCATTKAGEISTRLATRETLAGWAIASPSRPGFPRPSQRVQTCARPRRTPSLKLSRLASRSAASQSAACMRVAI